MGNVLNKNTLEDALESVSRVFQVERESLLTSNGKRLPMHARGCLFTLLSDQRYSRKDISDATGINPVTIWHWLKRWRRFLETDERTQRLYLQVQIRFARNQAKTIRKQASMKLAEIRAKKSPTC